LVGYVADPGYKDVLNLADVGYPIAEIDPSGEARITRTPSGSGTARPAPASEVRRFGARPTSRRRPMIRPNRMADRPARRGVSAPARSVPTSEAVVRRLSAAPGPFVLHARNEGSRR